MEATKPTVSESSSALIIAFFVLLACWSLFYLDHETRTISDLFKTGNLIALAIYFIPTFSLSVFLFMILRQKKSQATSMLLALIIGIPVSFAFIIAFFLAIR